jgi:Flp pilus assembly protein TadG
MNRPSERRRAKDQRPKERRGVTLVLVAVLFTALMGFVAMAVDFGRMYVFKAELKRAADAVAISIVFDKAKGRSISTIITNGTPVLQANKVERNKTPVVNFDQFDWVNYNFETGAIANGTWENSNGARLAVQDTASWTFLRVVGSNTRVLNEVSVAAFGSLKTSPCMTPFALSYGEMLSAIGETAPHTLTSGDLQELAGLTDPFTFKEKDPDGGNPTGSFGWVDIADGSSKQEKISNALSGSASCTLASVGTGGNPPVITGNLGASVREVIEAFCNGTHTGSGNGYVMTCSPSFPPVLVPIYDTYTEGSLGKSVHIAMVGAFKLQGQNKDGIIGHFTTATVPSTGTLGTALGPVTSVALVK